MVPTQGEKDQSRQPKGKKEITFQVLMVYQ